MTKAIALAAVLIAALVIAVQGMAAAAPSPMQAEASRQTPLPTLSPHLGYGINVRSQEHIDPLFAPLDLEWLKLWEEYDGLPATRYPYQVLFLIDCTGRTQDLEDWGDDVEAIAAAGYGLIEAYEICNEPNRAEWLNKGVDPHTPPDPHLYAQMLQVAYRRIKDIDPAAIVVSAGLAPVGRIQGTCNGWSGNNCYAMDEREFARQMLILGAGDYLDAFGYHPYGFVYEPEIDPYAVSNGFAFRGAEVVHSILEQHGLGHKPIWATEFGWLRDPSEDSPAAGWCHHIAEYENVFGWMDVPEARQASYITRAFQYADENWPWMGAMFVWNLDWHDYNWPCEPSRYFSVRKDDGTGPGSPAAAYNALAAMEKRPAYFGPRLAVRPTALTFLAGANEPGMLTRTLEPLNTGYGVLTWTAAVVPEMQITPTLVVTTGLQGTPLIVTVDSTGYTTGTYTGSITITAMTTGILNTPQSVPITLIVAPEIHRTVLPVVCRSAP